MHFEDGMTLGDIEHWLKDKGVNFSHATIMGWFEKTVVIVAPLDKPLQEEITDDASMHSDESTLKTCDARLPGKGEEEEDVTPEEHYFKRWIFCHYSPTWNLTQFIFHERGRRTREAEQKYLEEVSHKMYLHTEIRRITKYRNNSFFVGSPESGVSSARLQSVFANIRNHKLNAVTYLCDVFRRIGKTAKKELVNLLPHKWNPLTV